jgi:hypothetical protein
MAGFCNLAGRLQTPERTKSEADLPKVSGRHREYSRFRETDGGDGVRSPTAWMGWQSLNVERIISAALFHSI